MNKQTSKKLAEQEGLMPVQRDPLADQPAPRLPKPDSPTKILKNQRYHLQEVKKAAWIYAAWLLILIVALVAWLAW